MFNYSNRYRNVIINKYSLNNLNITKFLSNHFFNIKLELADNI